MVFLPIPLEAAVRLAVGVPGLSSDRLGLHTCAAGAQGALRDPCAVAAALGDHVGVSF